ncbi:MAG: 4Fe-4S dicluster domain-containing protein [Cytophagales bacterium]
MFVLSNLIFVALLTTTTAYACISFGKIRRNVLLGKTEDRSDKPLERLKIMLLVALGQKKMFSRPIPAILHLFIYVGFLIVNIEMLEIVIDGIFGTHRVFAPLLGSFYPILINTFEFFAFTVIGVCIVFLTRRNVLKINRFQSPELKKWPVLDANIILIVEIVLMGAFLNMNAFDQILQTKGSDHYVATGQFLFSQFLVPLYENLDVASLITFERGSWWVHIIGVFLFINYLPYSKHLHIMLAFPNTYFSNLHSKGEMQNMETVTKEVKSMLNLPVDMSANAETLPEKFGAKDVTDLSWKNLLEAYTCTECGRCTSVCPANITGKALSPRKIMMDTRDRLEEVGGNINQLEVVIEDGKSLLGDYITDEELLACTTCNACVEACPVNISPVDIILQLRRYRVMEESKAPQSWNGMFSNMETSASPWKFPPSDRFNWAEKV